MSSSFAMLKRFMSTKNEQYKTPGQLVSNLLKERGWTQKTLSVIMGVDSNAVSLIINAKRQVDASMAVVLEEVFNVPAKRFLDLQKSYDLAKARIEAIPDPDRKTRAHLYGELPVNDMIKRGWVNAKNVRDTENVEASLKHFFGVNRLEDIETLPHAAKRTEISVDATPTQLAWLYRVKSIASNMVVGKYSKTAVEKAIREIKRLLLSPDELRNVPRILADAGIRFVIVESLPSSKIDGVCFWLDEYSPVIGMTLRFDRIDNFCFVLRHELEHVKNRDGLETVLLDVDIFDESVGKFNDTIASQEKRANEAAADFCVPSNMMDKFIRVKAPLFSERDFLALSKITKVHPGLVAGQLQHKTKRFHLFRKYLVPIRKIVTASALTDGWGNIAPIYES